MEGTLARDLRQGFDRVAQALTPAERVLHTRAGECRGPSPGEGDQILARLVRAYRLGPRQLWAPVLLDLLAPALVDCMRHLRAAPPIVDEEEIRQQLVMELLHAATVIPIHPDGRLMGIRLVTRARRSVVRWLEREGVRQKCQTPLDAVEEVGAR